MRNVANNLVSTHIQNDLLKQKSLYIAPAYKNNDFAVIIKAIINNQIYFMDGTQIYKSFIKENYNGKYFKFLNKRFYFKDFEKLYL